MAALPSAGDIHLAAAQPRVRDESLPRIPRDAEIQRAGYRAAPQHPFRRYRLVKANAAPKHAAAHRLHRPTDALRVRVRRGRRTRGRRLRVKFAQTRRKLFDGNPEQREPRGGQANERFAQQRALAPRKAREFFPSVQPHFVSLPREQVITLAHCPKRAEKILPAARLNRINNPRQFFIQQFLRERQRFAFALRGRNGVLVL